MKENRVCIYKQNERMIETLHRGKNEDYCLFHPIDDFD
jgi:hypothetical protein